MRIVLDTNVVVSALLWRGTPFHLLSTIRQHQHAQLFATVPLLEELGDVLNRPDFARRLALIGRVAYEVLADYIDTVGLVTPGATPSVIAADPDDDHCLRRSSFADARQLPTRPHYCSGRGD